MKQMPNIMCLYIISIMLDVLVDHRNNLLILMCCVVTSRPKHFLISVQNVLLYFVFCYDFYTVIICKVYIIYTVCIYNLLSFIKFTSHIWQLFVKNLDFCGCSRDFLREGFGNTDTHTHIYINIYIYIYTHLFRNMLNVAHKCGLFWNTDHRCYFIH